MGIDCIGQRQVRHGPALINGHFVRILVHHANQKMSRILVGRFGSWLTFQESGNHVVLVPPAIVPGTGECDLSIYCLPQLSSLAAMHEWKHSSGYDGNIGAANYLQQ